MSSSLQQPRCRDLKPLLQRLFAQQFEDFAVDQGLLDRIGGRIDRVMGNTHNFIEFKAGDHDAMTDELGDLIFVMVNLARKMKVDPENALRRTVRRFIDRFGYIEESLKKQGLE